MSIDCLRLSVTDKCNLRCVYCHPLPGCGFIEHEKIPGFEEILRAVRLFADCGITKLRLTGGEPLLMPDIVHLVRELGAINGIKDLSATTNGVFLRPLAAELKAAGLQRINISVDSIDSKTYEKITGFDRLSKVLDGIYTAIDAGLNPVKINSVVIKDLNDSIEQITSLAGMSIELPLSVRFIEYCPTNKSTRPATDYVPNAEVRALIERKYGLLTRTVMSVGNGPAEYFKVPGSAGTIGFISGRSSNFCSSCSRLRLTSDGKVMPCLYSARNYDLKKLISSGHSDRQVCSFMNQIISEKAGYTKLNSLKEEFSMCKIGG